MGLPFNKIYKYIEGFTPSSLFAAGEQGAWYDPSDLTTLFQEYTGAIPVTLSPMEQPVGLMLDKSKGLALGAELKGTGVIGLAGTLATPATYDPITGIGSVSRVSYPGEQSYITFTGLVPNSFYKISISIISGSALNVRSGTYGAAGYLPIVSPSGVGYVPADGSGQITVTANNNSTITFTLTSIKQIAGNHAFQATSANRPLLSARVNLLLATATLSTQSVTSQATNYVLAFTGTGTVTLSGTATGTLSAGSNTFTATAGTLTLTVSGSVTLADLRPTNSGALLPPYQRVTTATDYDTAGFPLYLKCNGTSSAMSTNSINFTATDKMTVVTGVRKLEKTLPNILIELGNGTNLGSFGMQAPNSNVNDYLLESKGDFANTSIIASGFSAPINNIFTGLISITPASKIIRLNGVIIVSGTTNTDHFGYAVRC